MADPTPEELQQQIDELKQLITTTYEPPTGTEYSYPVVNQPMNDEMWAYVTRGIGNGVLDEGGQPYWLRGLENVNNTVRVTVSTTTNTAQAILKGFYHKLVEDKVFTVPAVSSNTTYYFCLTYDPTASTEPGGPISLQMYSGTPPLTMGRAHIVLWELDRKPNQLLTAATVRRVRPKVAPTITVDEPSHMPDPWNVLWGTQCYVASENGMYRAIGSSDETGGPTTWSGVSSPGWTSPGDTASYEWPGHGYRRGLRRIGDTLELRGRIARVGGGSFVNGGGDHPGGYSMYTLTTENTPQREQRFITASAGITGQVFTVVTVYPDGQVRAMPLLGNASWLSLDGIRIALKD